MCIHSHGCHIWLSNPLQRAPRGREAVLDKVRTSTSERSILKNLGSWLGLQTIARNKPLLNKYLNLRDLLFEALEQGTLLVVMPFVSKVLEHCTQGFLGTAGCPQWPELCLCSAIIDSGNAMGSLSCFKISLPCIQQTQEQSRKCIFPFFLLTTPLWPKMGKVEKTGRGLKRG